MTFELLTTNMFWIVGFFAVVAVGVALGALGVLELARTRPAAVRVERDRQAVAPRGRRLALHH